MIKLFSLIFLLNALFVADIYGQNTSQVVVTEDIDLFWTAFDRVQSTTDSLTQFKLLQELYVEKGTPGLKAFMEAKGYTTAAWLDCIRRYPKFWKSIRKKTYQVKTINKQLNPYLRKFRALYPALKPANIYFSIGAMRSGGTTQGDKVLIGAELATGDPEVDVSELPPNIKTWLTTYFGTYPFRDIVLLNMHEYVHTQQKESENSLLGQSLKEGAADFVAELITGKVPAMAYMSYGKANEVLLKGKFKEEMFLSSYGNWLYNGASNVHGVSDLGYFMGYAICKKYYDRAQDKKLAIKELIELDYGDEAAVELFLRKTNYFEEGFDKQALLASYESKKPQVTHIGPFANHSVDIDAATKELTIFFSKPMNTKRMSINLGKGGETAYPFTKSLGFSEDGKSLKMQMDLKAGQTYNCVITGRSFVSVDGYPLADFSVSFTTKK